MLKYRVSIKPLNLQDIEEKILKTYAEDIKDELVSSTPGEASRFWMISDPVRHTITISNPKGYLKYVEKGTGLYGPRRAWIRPKSATMLSWMEGNRRIFATKTRGMKPRPFIADAVREGMAKAYEELNGNV